jgi:hypothetical protein
MLTPWIRANASHLARCLGSSGSSSAARRAAATATFISPSWAAQALRLAWKIATSGAMPSAA